MGKPSGRWTEPRAIPVCWMQRSGYEAQQTLVRQTVTSEYARVGIGFTGWRSCRPDDMDSEVIRVEFRSAVSAGDDMFTVGCSLIGMTAQSLGGCSSLITGSTLWIVGDAKFNIAASALHEFGHAVGLYHEHERNDRTACKITDTVLWPSTDVQFLTPFDPNSIMSYCSKQEQLSAGDVSGLQHFYGIRPQPVVVAPRPRSSEPRPVASSCLGADGTTVYADGVRTVYRHRSFTCDNGHWR